MQGRELCNTRKIIIIIIKYSDLYTKSKRKHPKIFPKMSLFINKSRYFVFIDLDKLTSRVQSIRQGVRGFVRDHDAQCQIINLGAGSDTLFWNLIQEGIQPACFVELDFPQV